jgi:hypothetical protein
VVSVRNRNSSWLGFVFLLSLLTASLFGGQLPAHAEASDAPSEGFLAGARDRALRNYGWKTDAANYIAAHTHLVATAGGFGSPCPSAVACSLRDGSVYVNMIPDDPKVLDYVLNHEYMHAMEYARGSSDGTVGRILADVFALSKDTNYPAAASAAQRVLGLTGRDDHPVVTDNDWFHIEHDILEDIGWDVAGLPGWYRDAYFPYLWATPPVRTKVNVASGPAPRDTDLRMQRVLDTIVKLCGPVLPGARLSAPSVACGPAPLWSGMPYPAMAGNAAPAPAPVVAAPAPAPVVAAPASAPVVSAPAPAPVASAPAPAPVASASPAPSADSDSVVSETLVSETLASEALVGSTDG